MKSCIALVPNIVNNCCKSKVNQVKLGFVAGARANESGDIRLATTESSPTTKMED